VVVGLGNVEIVGLSKMQVGFVEDVKLIEDDGHPGGENGMPG